jgi:cystathionine gamma-synthase
MKIETLAVHAARTVDSASSAVAAPINMSTTFERSADGSYAQGFSYSRPDNPTRRALEQCLAQLEGGADAVCFASGSAASMAVFSLLRPGEHVIGPRECYHGTRQQLRDVVAGWGGAVDLVDTTDPAQIERHLRRETRLIWIETPSNPRLHLTDIAATARLARSVSARLACDNTFATPILQQPLALGADFVMHSSTKYFGGHSDVMGGAIVMREQDEAATRIRNYQAIAGAVPSPFDCWLIRRSIATLPYRMRAQSANAGRVAEFLARDARVEQVFYPGLSTHPGHALARTQMPGFGAMVSVCVRGGAREAMAVAARSRLFLRATSLGGVESLIEHRASVEGPDTPTPQNLLRLSIGLENAEDLIADLDQALG